MNLRNPKPLVLIIFAAVFAALAGCEKVPGGTPLHEAAISGNLAKAKQLIAEGADVNAKSKDGSSPLHAAADELEIAQLLIESGANVNAKAADDDTPLHQADNPAVTLLLLENGADIEAADVNGDTPLHKVDELQAAVVLLEHGADVHAQNNTGWTPVDWAIHEKRPEIRQLIEERGGRCNKLC